VLVHGWGWHGGVWDAVAREFAREYRVWIPDLPGHGRSRGTAVALTLADLAKTLCAGVPRGAVWVGWSLGGLIALAAAASGDVRRMVLVGTTPRFVQGVDWTCGLARRWFDDFLAELSSDTGRALARFASLHLAGIGNERPLLRQLRTEMSRYGSPDTDALCAGMRALEESDLRSQLAATATPALVWHGACDRIAPLEAAERLARGLPQGRLAVVGEAGHAPFLSHPNEFAETVGAFLRE